MIFTVFMTPRSRRQYEKMIRRQPGIQLQVDQLLAVLEKDPYNLTKYFDIKKLVDEQQGQWRIRSGNYRLRYDIDEEKIIIQDVFDRKKGY